MSRVTKIVAAAKSTCYMSAMNSHAEIINRWPDAAVFAREVGIDPGLARQFRHRKRIPSRYWLQVVEASKVRRFGITLDLLAQTQEAPP